jgi:hypothetical protein
MMVRVAAKVAVRSCTPSVVYKPRTHGVPAAYGHACRAALMRLWILLVSMARQLCTLQPDLVIARGC